MSSWLYTYLWGSHPDVWTDIPLNYLHTEVTKLHLVQTDRQTDTDRQTHKSMCWVPHTCKSVAPNFCGTIFSWISSLNIQSQKFFSQKFRMVYSRCGFTTCNQNIFNEEIFNQQNFGPQKWGAVCPGKFFQRKSYTWIFKTLKFPELQYNIHVVHYVVSYCGWELVKLIRHRFCFQNWSYKHSTSYHKFDLFG